MNSLTITKQQARRFLLTHQGLWPARRYSGKEGVLEYIRHVGCIQYDPLDIVGRNAELALQSRVAGFRAQQLEELLYNDRQLLDGWDKNMSIYLLEDWPFFRRHREAASRNPRLNPAPLLAALPEILSEIETRGPLSSRHLAHDQRIDWPWAPARLGRAALENLYWRGGLVIHHKERTRKVYDLAQRHIPERLRMAPDPHGSEEAYHDWHLMRRIGGVGLLWDRSGDAWLGLSSIKGKERKAALARLMARGLLEQVYVDGIAWPFYLRSTDRPRLEEACNNAASPPEAAILAPLDNLLWDRRLVKELFGFDYRWEVYKPAKEREHGYYVLPVLHGDRFVARFEPGRDKTSGALVIKNWWWEPDFTPTKPFQADLCRCFERFIGYLGTGEIRIERETRAKENLEWLRQ